MTTELIDLTPSAVGRPAFAVFRQEPDERLFDCASNVTRMNVVAVVGPQGGAGKTRVTFALGSALAQFAGLNVVAVDLDDDYGALLDLVPEATRTQSSLDSLPDDVDGPVTLPVLRAHMSVTRSRMLVARAPGALDSTEWERELASLDEMLGRLRNADVVIFDCAGGLSRLRPRWAMRNADQVVVVARHEASGASASAYKTSEALEDVAAPGTLVLNRCGRRAPHAAQAFQSVSGLAQTVLVPESRRLAKLMESQRYRTDSLDLRTRRAVRELATVVGGQLR